MHTKKISSLVLYLSIWITLTNIACAQQESIVAKDDPAIPTNAQNSETMPFLSDELKSNFMESQIVEAYTFEKAGIKTTKDTSIMNVKGFKPIGKIPRLSSEQISELQNILSSEITYEKGDEIAKCGWHPDLAFIFKTAQQDFSVLLSSINNCNVIKMYKGQEKVLVKMCTPGRSDFVQLAKVLFPEAYGDIPISLEPPTNEPVDSTATPTPTSPMNPDSSNINNNHDETNN